MTYFLLAVTVISCGIQNIVAKCFNKNNSDKNPYVYSAVVTASAMLFFILTSGGNFEFNAKTLAYSLAFAVAYACATVGNLMAISLGTLSVSSLINQLALILPTLYGILFLKENIGFWGYVGLFLVFACLVLVNFNANGSENKKLSPRWIFYVTVGFFGNGMCSVIQKMQQLQCNGAYKNEFMIAALFVATAVMLAVGAFKGDVKQSFCAAVKYAPFQGLANGVLNMLVMMLSALLLAAVLFPIVLAGGTVISFAASLTVFKERLSAVQLLGYALGICSIVFLNI